MQHTLDKALAPFYMRCASLKCIVLQDHTSVGPRFMLDGKEITIVERSAYLVIWVAKNDGDALVVDTGISKAQVAHADLLFH